LKRTIRNRFLERTHAEWCEAFKEVDACVEPMLSFEEAQEHPQLKSRALVVEVPDSVGTTRQQLATPLRFSQTPPHYRHTGGPVGEHTVKVLLGLGYTDEKIQELLKDKAAHQSS
jgi:crotonobetainyl-CoA:carnitine CoA-transferase CaiB-like acyl-CoA transferase